MYKRGRKGSFYRDVEDFHLKYKLGYAGPPRMLEDEVMLARCSHQQEELAELLKGTYEKDKEQVLDALVDTVYVALGTAYLMGFNFCEAWDRVHEANMKKIRMKTKRSPIDIVKPVGWKSPKLKDLCE
jgi:predicted HAD superfamily Cof-like phosphohydrolase